MTETSNYRYGFYLRPDYATSKAIADAHQLLRAQYGFITAGLFMPHATIKGFCRSDADIADMVTRLDAAFAGFKPCTVYNGGIIKMGSGLVTSWQHLPDGVTPNPGLIEASDRSWAALEPLIHPDCDFRHRDPRGSQFHAHITVAMADIPRKMQDEVMAFLNEGGRLGSTSFVANTYHLFRFKADWQANWWHTLTWDLLHSWQF